MPQSKGLSEILPLLDPDLREERPSPILIQSLWTRIQNDAQRIEKLFLKIAGRIQTMRAWERFGIVNVEELEQAEEWYAIRSVALSLLFGRNELGVFLDQYFYDGGGI